MAGNIVYPFARAWRAIFGSPSNFTEIEPDGSIELHGDATVWDDMKFPFTQTRLGALLKPDFDYTNLGLLFPQNDAAEKAYAIGQFSHKWKLASNIYPHIHWIQSQADLPVWKLDYRWYNNGDAVPGGFTTISSSAEVFAYSAGSILQISTFPAISGAGIDSVSSILDLIIYRDDNVVVGDVLGKEFDIHYEIDTLGSRTEFTK